MQIDRHSFGGRLRISDAVAAKLEAHHLAPGKDVESLSYALGHAYRGADGQLTIVVAEPGDVLLFAPDCFISSGYGHVTLDRQIKAKVFHRAVEGGFTAVVDIHDHHFSHSARFSSTDTRDDRVNARYLKHTVQAFMPPGRELFAAAIVISRGDWAARFVDDQAPGGPAFSALRIDRIGARAQCMSDIGTPVIEERFARNEGLVSAREQNLIGRSHAVVVGAGGTGSIALESLLRLGFGKVSVIDADRVEASNLNRLQGAGPADIGRLKIDVLADHARRIAPATRFEGVAAKCFDEAARPLLESADLILGCVDNPETRWWLNQLAVQYMIPWFDCGVLLHTQPAVHHEVRTSMVLPTVTACGHCAPVEFCPRKLPTQFMDLESLRQQRAAGYLAQEPQKATPSAYLVNQQAVSWMLREVMNWYCGWAPAAASVFWRSDSTQIQRLDATLADLWPDPGCPVCGTQAGLCREGRLPATGSHLVLAAAANALLSEAMNEVVPVPCLSKSH
ncbi:ThiF family adenylyltransferase [Polaromonas sp.]|uniref:HesA/MoeB/ThiF family protein n=1 Tax=Polaromonas sp. TaxID=1869339 RepID=UPI00272F96ED|nr:ThiF family adenylyltransferase [Polaromonas sp.]MDP1740952.1 ThiF family adenylyltransferase [Polaromonas sp.]